MRVLLAQPRGFCAGVDMAIDTVEQALRIVGPPLYVYHEIVHNKHVVQSFRERGVVFIDEVEEAPVGSTLVYSAHGVSPDVRRRARERNLTEIDATCPLVTKVHMEVIRFARDGCTILFVGHRRHEEAIGAVGEAPNAIIVIESVRDVEALNFPAGAPVAMVTQTTLSVADAARMTAAIRAKFPNVRIPMKQDICYATTNRQNAVSALAGEADVILVIGSGNSSNSHRLVECAQDEGRAAYLIDDDSELDPKWLAGAKTVLVTAGASAPEHLVERLLDRLRCEYGAEVEPRAVVDETMHFELPRSLRRLQLVR